MKNFYLGIDVGGTNIKAGIVDDENNIIDSLSFSTKSLLSSKTLAEAVKEIIFKVLSKNDASIDDCLGIGIGVPGVVENATGKILKADNLNIQNQDFLSELKNSFNVPIKIANDADVALLAESKLGAGKNYKNIVMLTLGTGVGGSVMLGGKILGLEQGVPFEVGHIKIQGNSNKCACGEIGCFETVASTKALVLELKNAISADPTSAIWRKYNISNIDGKTIFEFPKDYTARETLKSYIKNVGAGFVSLVNLFKPELLIIGGAISAQKENLINPLEIYVNRHNFFRQTGYNVKVVPASFLNDAGILGAKLLFC